jgi:hypothetical protein
MSQSTRQPPEADNIHPGEMEEEGCQFTMEQKWHQPVSPGESNQSDRLWRFENDRNIMPKWNSILL